MKMRVVLFCSALPLALAASAFAQQPGAPQSQNPGQQTQPQTFGQPGQQAQQNAAQPSQIQAKIRQNLQAAGFTDIHMMPSSFMVRAKDKDGNPVMMVINPDSIEAVTFEGVTNNNRTTGQGSSNQQPGSSGQSNQPSGSNRPGGNR